MMMSSPAIICLGAKDLENEVKLWTTWSTAYTCQDAWTLAALIAPDDKWVNMRLLSDISHTAVHHMSVCEWERRKCERTVMLSKWILDPLRRNRTELFGLTWVKFYINVSQATACAKSYSKSLRRICLFPITERKTSKFVSCCDQVNFSRGFLCCRRATTCVTHNSSYIAADGYSPYTVSCWKWMMAIIDRSKAYMTGSSND